MKLQTVIIAISALVTPIAVIAQSEELFGGKYPYCNGCEAKYENEDGQWNYIDHTWCKVNEEKCNTASTCEPVDGYPCCKDSSLPIVYTDDSGNWSIENNNWCIMASAPTLATLDIEIEVGGWLDLMPGTNYSSEKEAYYYIRPAGIEVADFLEKYEVTSLTVNGNQVSTQKIYPDRYLGFRFNSIYYDRTKDNNVKFTLKNKKTNQIYNVEYDITLEITY